MPNKSVFLKKCQKSVRQLIKRYVFDWVLISVLQLEYTVYVVYILYCYSIVIFVSIDSSKM